jgi:hypothetical protein
LAARLTVIVASRNSTSVRGSITSRTCRSPTPKTSSISFRSSPDSDSCAATSPRSSSSVIDSRLAAGSAPSSRTTPLVVRDSSQISGRNAVAMRSSGAAASSATRSARCSPIRFGANSPSTSAR